MSEAGLRVARSAARGGRPAEAASLAAAVAASEASPHARFDAWMLRAALLDVALGRSADALACYEAADALARVNRLDRAGEADLGRAVALLELDRLPEATRFAERATRAFRQRGHVLLRACAETVLAWAALEADDRTCARRLAVAHELAAAADEPRLLSALLVLEAELAARHDQLGRAERLLRLAAGTSLRLADEDLVGELRRRRAEVRRRLALDLPAG